MNDEEIQQAVREGIAEAEAANRTATPEQFEQARAEEMERRAALEKKLGIPGEALTGSKEPTS